MTSGGTVTYRKAEWIAERDRWVVTFPDGRVQAFTAEQGEAMGLTPLEPAPLVVTCNGHDIELSDEMVEAFGDYWERVPEGQGPRVDASVRLARLLRDARQDPQPASDENAPGSATPGEQGAGVTCTPAPDTDTPDTDTPGDDIDFDALPSRYVRAVGRDGVVRGTFTANGDVAFRRHPDGSVYFDGTQVLPALSPRQHLEALLAGRDDADELMAEALTWPNEAISEDPNDLLVSLIGAAAREVHG